MSEKRSRKRNRPLRRDVLLDRVMAFAEAEHVQLVSERQVLRDLIQQGPAVVLGDAHHELATWPLSRVALVQQHLRDFLRSVVELADADGGRVPELTVDRLTFGVTPIDGDVIVTVDGAALDVVRFQAVQLLQAAGAARLRRCAAPDCGKVFAKTGRREFCSATCQKRVYMREQRAKERTQREKGRQHGKTTRKG